MTIAIKIAFLILTVFAFLNTMTIKDIKRGYLSLATATVLAALLLISMNLF